MIEIAIALAVIGFAVVAIIGVLPAGMNVQRDNREDTIINQDGPYLLEAIRSGARGFETLTNYVDDVRVTLVNASQNRVTNVFNGPFLGASNIIGLLSIPRGAVDPFSGNAAYTVERVQANVRALSGGVAEQGVGGADLAFRYLLTCEIVRPANSADVVEHFGTGPVVPGTAASINVPGTMPELELTTNRNARALYLPNTLYEVRLTFRWPVLSGGALGNNRQVFRTYVSGTQQKVKNFYFFQPQSYAKVP